MSYVATLYRQDQTEVIPPSNFLLDLILILSQPLQSRKSDGPSLKMKKNSLSFLIFCFHFFCFSLFLIEVYLCLDSYHNQGVGTNSLKRRQEFYNRPEICLSAYKFLHDGFNDSLDIEYDDYIKGKWKIKNMSEESLFESIAPKLHDLIQARL